MKIIVVGGTGLIGKAVVKELSANKHEVIIASYSKGDVLVDMTKVDSITKMYQKVGEVDAVVVAAGGVVFNDFAKLTEDDFYLGIRDKLMGQVNLVRIGCNFMRHGGSFTLIGGLLSHDPIRKGISASMINAGLEGFVISSAIELPKSLRINLVSPAVVAEAMSHYGEYFKGYAPVSVEKVALAYLKSVAGAQTGQIYRVGH
jgi:NAD(P)-dependent dehydrogenase (short-subunit alcohol dehydrogenase family)